jgi:hypothetical protein
MSAHVLDRRNRKPLGADQTLEALLKLEKRDQLMMSGWKPTNLTSVFSLRTSVLLPDGTTLTALIQMLIEMFVDVRLVGFLQPSVDDVIYTSDVTRYSLFAIQQHVLDTKAGKQLSSAATYVQLTMVLKKRTTFKDRLEF